MVEPYKIFVAERIAEALRTAGITAAEAARQCDITPQAVNGWLRTGRVGKRHLAIIARLTSRPLEWFLEPHVASPKGAYDVPIEARELLNQAVPVVGTAQLGDNGFWSELEYPAGHGDGFVRYPTRDSNAYALRVKGDSMRPRIKPGEFVIVEPHAPIEPGHEVLVKTHDGRVMVKVLNFRRNGIIELASINEDHKPITIEENAVELIHSVAGIAKEALYTAD